jgi:hypothetical protein
MKLLPSAVQVYTLVEETSANVKITDITLNTPLQCSNKFVNLVPWMQMGRLQWSNLTEGRKGLGITLGCGT